MFDMLSKVEIFPVNSCFSNVLTGQWVWKTQYHSSGLPMQSNLKHHPLYTGDAPVWLPNHQIPSHPSPVVLYINSVSTKANIQSIVWTVKSSPCLRCFVWCMRVSASMSPPTQLYLFTVFPGPASVFSPKRDDSLPHWSSVIISSGNS